MISSYLSIAFEVLLLVNVGEDTIALPLADIERFPISRVNEPVHVGFQLANYVRSERFAGCLYAGAGAKSGELIR